MKVKIFCNNEDCTVSQNYEGLYEGERGNFVTCSDCLIVNDDEDLLPTGLPDEFALLW